MTYEPVPGVDYMVDYYRVLGVESTTEPKEIGRVVNGLLFEVHPDRLQGLAAEFNAAGERKTRLLYEARKLLLDPDKRDEYNNMLAEWEGPVSTDGSPVIRMEDALRAEAARMSPEELEAAFARKTHRVKDAVKHNPEHQAWLAELLEVSGGEDERSRDMYDAALFAEDQMLAIEERDRSELLGIAHDKGYEISLGYTETVHLAIETARPQQREEYRRRVLGGVSTRLALLTGQDSPEVAVQAVVPTQDGLPHYFDGQAQKVMDLAARREEILKRRLEMYRPIYPIAEQQTELRPRFVIGITGDPEVDHIEWIEFNFDPDNVTLTNSDMPGEIEKLLKRRQYEEVYARGYSILTVALKENIDPRALLEEACNKHVRKMCEEDGD